MAGIFLYCPAAATKITLSFGGAGGHPFSGVVLTLVRFGGTLHRGNATMYRFLVLALLGWAFLAPVPLRAESSPFDDLFGQGAHAYFAGDYATAYARLNAAIDAGSRDPRAYYFRGLCSTRMGREDDARRDYARGAELEIAASDRSAEIATSLQRVQGRPRATLEAYRSRVRATVAQAHARPRPARSTVRTPEQVAAKPALKTDEPPPTLPNPAEPKTDAADPFASPPAAAAPEKMTTKPADDPFAAPPAAPAVPAAATPAAPPAEAAAASSAPAAAMPAEPKGATPLAADATVMAAARAVTDQQPQLLWTLLPAKYQDDVKSVIAEVGAKADPDLWAKTFQVFGKFVQVAKEKKEFILAHPLLAAGPVAGNKDTIVKGWDDVVALLEIVITSEIGTADGMKTLDPEKFLAGTGQKVIDQLTRLADLLGPPAAGGQLDKLKSLKATLVSTEGDLATVKIEAAGEPPIEARFKLVDGKWLPEPMVMPWDENIAKAKASLAAVDPAAQKAQGMAVLTMVEGVLDQLLAAKDQESFDTVINSVTSMVSAFMPKPGAMPPMAPPM